MVDRRGPLGPSREAGAGRRPPPSRPLRLSDVPSTRHDLVHRVLVRPLGDGLEGMGSGPSAGRGHVHGGQMLPDRCPASPVRMPERAVHRVQAGQLLRLSQPLRREEGVHLAEKEGTRTFTSRAVQDLESRLAVELRLTRSLYSQVRDALAPRNSVSTSDNFELPLPALRASRKTRSGCHGPCRARSAPSRRVRQRRYVRRNEFRNDRTGSPPTHVAP